MAVASLLSIRVTPRSSMPGIGEWKSDPAGRPFLEVRVAAAPADGGANDELISLLSKSLALPRGEIMIVSGHAARLKRVKLPIDEAEFLARLSR